MAKETSKNMEKKVPKFPKCWGTEVYKWVHQFSRVNKKYSSFAEPKHDRLHMLMSGTLYTMEAVIKTSAFQIHSCCSILFLFLKVLLLNSTLRTNPVLKVFKRIPLLKFPSTNL